MSTVHLKDESPLRRIWRWLRDQLVGEVPQEAALCEFDCRKAECQMGEWEKCPRRLDEAAYKLRSTPENSIPES